MGLIPALQLCVRRLGGVHGGKVSLYQRHFLSLGLTLGGMGGG